MPSFRIGIFSQICRVHIVEVSKETKRNKTKLSIMVKFSTATLGFSRMGPNRELKFALEKHWKGQLDEAGLIQVANEVEDTAWTMQVDAGINKVTVGDFCLYDNVLQWADCLGVVPARFQSMEGGMERMFAMARGVDGAPALSKSNRVFVSKVTLHYIHTLIYLYLCFRLGMKKWLTANYHYMVPEVDETLGTLHSDFTSYLESVKRGIDKLGAQRASPVVMGPVSFVRLCTFKQQGSQDLQRFALLEKLLPLYKDLLVKLKAMGVKEIQIHEPALVFADSSLKTLFQQAYPGILPADVAINMVSFFEGVNADNYKWLLSVPQVNILSLDFTRGDNLDLVKKFGVQGKTIGAGIIDGRNVWKVNPDSAILVLKTLSESDAADIRVQPSCSLQFVPWNIECEHDILAQPLGSVLAFGKQKLKEVSDVCSVATDSGNLDAYYQAWQSFQANRKGNSEVTRRAANLTESDFSRSEPYAVRRKQQLPGVLLPTTTIGSFPQTKEIRSLRHQLKKGKITLPEYNRAIDQQIAMMIGIQEGLGLDILVHGEPERTDMVEFFGQQMEGMAFTVNGWVQSFGSRCVRPPIIWTDISRPSSMTVREFKVAQALTQKPVKGMLTG